MRVVAGTHRGRVLNAPKGQSTRPTTDRDREAIFSALSHQLDQDFEGLRALDLFAGSGLLGLETLSRGAAHCTFVEKDPKAIAIIKANVAALQEEANSKVLRASAVRLPSQAKGPFDLVFADAPYGKHKSVKALTRAHAAGLLSAQALCVIECSLAEQTAVEETQWQICWERSRGETYLAILRPNST